MAFLNKPVLTGEWGLLRHPLFNTIIGSGALAFLIFYVTWKVGENEKARDQLMLGNSRQTQLHGKLLDEGEKSLSVLAGYRVVAVWINAAKPDELFEGRITKSEAIQSSIQLYTVYIQTPKLEGLLEQIKEAFPSGMSPTNELSHSIARLEKDVHQLRKATNVMDVQMYALAADKELIKVAGLMQKLASKDSNQ